MAKTAKQVRRLLDAYRFPGFRPQATVKGVFGDPKARIVTLVRRGKKRCAVAAVIGSPAGTTTSDDVFGTCHVATHASGWNLRCAACRAGCAAR